MTSRRRPLDAALAPAAERVAALLRASGLWRCAVRSLVHLFDEVSRGALEPARR